MDNQLKSQPSKSKNIKTEKVINIKENSHQELEVHLTEYKAMQDHMMANLDTQRQLIGLELLVITVAVSGFAVLQDQPSFLLIGALLLGLLTWIMFENTIKGQLLSTYIEETLDVRIEGIVNAPVFSYESYFTSVSQRTIVYAILSLAKFLLGILLGILLLVFFWIIKTTAGTDPAWTIEEKILFIISIVVLVVPLVLGSYSAWGRIKMPNRNK